MKLQIETLESEKANLNQEISELRTFLDSEKSITFSLAEKVKELEVDISKLKKSAAGLKSGFVRAKASRKNSLDGPSPAANQVVSTSRRCEDYVAITGVFENTTRFFFKGMRFSKCSAGTEKSNNKEGIFASLSCDKPNSAACDKTLSERATHLFHILCVLSGLAPGQALDAVG